MFKKYKHILFFAVLIITFLLIYLFVSDKEYNNNNFSEKFYPNLPANLDAISKINIQSSTYSYTLLKKDNKWVLPDHFDYPINIKKINSFLLEMVNLKVLDKKTSDAKYYDKLGLSVPIKEDKNSKLVEIFNIENKLLFNFIIGKKSKVANKNNIFYIRKVNDKQAWIFLNNFNIYESELMWADSYLFKMGRWRIRSVNFNVYKKKKKNFNIYRKNYDDGGYNLDSLPKGYEVKQHLKLNTIASILENIEILNVYKVNHIKNIKPFRTIEFIMFDGQKVKLYIYQKETKKIIAFKVESDFLIRKELPDDGPKIVGLPEMFSETKVKDEEKRYKFLDEWLYEIDDNSLKNLLINKSELIKKVI